MSEPVVIKATVSVWLSSNAGPHILHQSPERAVSDLTFYEPYDDPSYERWQAMGYVYVGVGDVVVRLIEQEAMVERYVASLRAEKTRVLGEAYARATSIESDIQKLLAIDYTSVGEVKA